MNIQASLDNAEPVEPEKGSDRSRKRQRDSDGRRKREKEGEVQ